MNFQLPILFHPNVLSPFETNFQSYLICLSTLCVSVISVVLNFSFRVGFLFKFDNVYYFLLIANRKMDG
jgi:hypothetical protein